MDVSAAGARGVDRHGKPDPVDGIVAVIAPRRSRRSSGPDFGTGNYVAIQAVGAALYLDGISVEGPLGAGVYGSEGAFVVLDNSFVYAGQAVASLATASFLVRNSFLQASDSGVIGHVAGADGDGELRIVYSTILGVTQGAVLCDGESEVQVRNSVLLTEREDAADTIDCPDADVSYSVLSTPYSGFGNVEVGHYTLNEWHHAPDTGFEIGLRLTPQGAELVRDIAMWRDRDPVVDIDGQSRPARPGAADYAGCEIP